MSKQGIWVLWIGCLAAMFLLGGWLSTIGSVVFWLLVIAHLAEFVMKRDVFARVGGSMGHHFVQTMIYGFMHWKPLEEGLGGGESGSDG